jgi:hypothetical protein
MNPTRKIAATGVSLLDEPARRAAGNIPAAALPADRFLSESVLPGFVLPAFLERCDFFVVAICLCVS